MNLQDCPSPERSVYTDSSASPDDSFEQDAPMWRMMRRSHKIVSIEGNIGSGKTTLLSNVKKALQGEEKIIFLKEPVDDWESIRDKNGLTMLQKFYADQEKYSFPL
jgi:predicted AAA+ superfamily ATPase